MNADYNKTDSVLEEPLKTDKGSSKILIAPNGKRVKATRRLAGKSRPRLGDLGDILSDVGFLDAVKKASSNEKIFRRALADPKGYLEREGVLLPPGAIVKMAEKPSTKRAFQVSFGGWITVEWKATCVELGSLEICGGVKVKVTFDTA